jgi:tetratricopeptide (TPR) repeat protein
MKIAFIFLFICILFLVPSACTYPGKVITDKKETKNEEIKGEKEYTIEINDLIRSAEKYLEKGEFEKSGIAFRNVLDNYPKEQSQRSRIRSSKESIESFIGTCSKELMGQGLLKYRNGNLAGAIETWKKILLFDPDYHDARRAIETASIQLRNIKAIKTSS